MQSLSAIFSHFNPRSPCGERRRTARERRRGLRISIHAPRAGSDVLRSLSVVLIIQFQSTLPVRGATYCTPHAGRELVISIHAPRAGSDAFIHVICVTRAFISIHAPRAGSDVVQPESGGAGYVFQSTLPVRGATPHGRPRGAFRLISIHAPRAGSDDLSNRWVEITALFQSTLPVRGATPRGS